MNKQDIQQPWNGEGLPPVGTVCECRVPHGISGSYIWQECKVLYVFDGTKECAVQHIAHSSLYYSDEFRPIRTPEQIEAERRERVIEAMKDYYGGSTIVSVFEAIYEGASRGCIEGVKIDG